MSSILNQWELMLKWLKMPTRLKNEIKSNKKANPHEQRLILWFYHLGPKEAKYDTTYNWAVVEILLNTNNSERMK